MIYNFNEFLIRMNININAIALQYCVIAFLFYFFKAQTDGKIDKNFDLNEK